MFDSDITIQGGPFVDPVKFRGILCQRMNLVYGRNGSGKTSIAKAFQEQQVVGVPKPYDREFKLSFDGSGSLPSDVQNHLFVFNERFIDDSVKFSKDGLKSIVRIGSSAQLDGAIQAAKDKIADLKGQRSPLAEEAEALAGNRAGSIAEYEKGLKNGLKADGGFIERLSRLEGRRPNLTGILFDQITGTSIKSSGSFSVDVAKAKLNAEIDRYLTLQDGTPVTWQAPVLSGIPDLDEINALLEKVIRPAELSAEEQAILDDVYVVLASENLGSKTQAWLVDEDRTICPLCHQPVTPEHKHLLADRLLRFRNLQEDDFKNRVESALQGIGPFAENLPAIPVSQYRTDLDRGKDALANLNSYLLQVRDALEKKRINPLSPQRAFDKQDLNALVMDCQSALDQLEAEVDSYNRSMQEKRQLLDRLKQDNMTLAIHENLPWILEYNRRKDRKEELDQQLFTIDRDIADQEGIITQLQGKIDQVDDAREQINDYLDIIFGQKKLRLVNAGRDQYRLQLRSGGTYKDIPPRAVSSGERNALALAYFFACVMEKKERDYGYDDPTLLVIDDPVSSFDAENKAGVISLLSLQCKKVLKGNPVSKVLLFTHDQTTLRELCALRSSMSDPEDEQAKKYLLLSPSRKLKEIPCNKILENMEYDAELNAIFGFAKCSEPEEFDQYDTMGNTLRRFAESYATRMFKCSWAALFSSDRRLECLPEDLRDRISTFAIRPVLNSASHGVVEEFEPSELQRAARILLIYISYASADHLRAYLVGANARNEWKMDKIDEWAGEI